ncbi:MAG: methionine--tRNA ligase [Verrucomicrobiae bacterium]|nr:methionine--tRNA ligase [Verrucomicrobiae bacterium]
MPKGFFITTPIYYVNDRPHLGHASTTIWADVQARFRRRRGEKVFFLTGLDEHGIKVQQAAQRRGVEPLAHCDEMAGHYCDLWKALDIRCDDFIRTTEPRHMKVVQAVLQKLCDTGQLYRKPYRGWYSKSAEQFVTEKDRVEGKWPAHFGEVLELEEENWFFRMSDHQEWLRRYIQENPRWIRPENRRNQILAILDRPLDDLCISRPKARLAWGIPLPFDPEYVTYVWFDALVNYITAPGFGEARFKEWWPTDCHLIAKDILVPHCIYWPTMLHAAGIEQPKCILAHGWWLMGRDKMSKSLGNIVDPRDYAARFGTDAVRYFVCRELLLADDTDFTEERFLARFNADLANDLGNLVNRAISMVHRYRGGVVPATGEPTPADADLAKVARETRDDYHARHMPNVEYGKALEAVWALVTRANRYVDENAPWKLAKDPAAAARLDGVLARLIETIALLGSLLEPFMPSTAAKIAAQLNVPEFPCSDERWVNPAGAGHALGRASPIFPRAVAGEKSAP